MRRDEDVIFLESSPCSRRVHGRGRGGYKREECSSLDTWEGHLKRLF